MLRPNASSVLTGKFHKEPNLDNSPPLFFKKLLPWQPLTKLRQSHYIAGALFAVTSLCMRRIYSGELCRWAEDGTDGAPSAVPQDECPGFLGDSTSSPYVQLLEFTNFPVLKCIKE